MADFLRTINWKRDSNFKQCEAMVQSTTTGRRCRYDAIQDSDPPRCIQHMHTGERRGVEGHLMSRYYLKALRPTLAKKLEEVIDELGSLDSLDLTEELALMRVTAGDAVSAYAEACETPEDDPKGRELRILAGTMMASKLQDVAKMAESAGGMAELRTRLQTAFAQVMTSVISSIAHAAWEVWGDDYRVKEFEELIRTKLEARALVVEGTTMTPDQVTRDARLMDETIPAVSDVSEGEATVQSNGEEV